MLESVRLISETVGAEVIAEGIEQPEELETLEKMGVLLGQGFLFSPPSTFSVHTPRQHLS